MTIASETRAIDAGSLCAVLRAGAALLAVDVALRVVGFNRVRSWLRHGGGDAAEPPAGAGALVERTRLAVDRARRYHVYPMRCLTRSLVLQWLLARGGVKTMLRIGVSKQDGHLSAHAWIEWNGQPVGEPERVGERFVPLLSAEVPR